MSGFGHLANVRFWADHRFDSLHLSQADRRLIFERGRPDRRLYEIATLAALRDRLRSADIWVDGNRSFRPIDEHLMPRSTFTTMKDEERLGLGVQGDGLAWLTEARQMLDCNLKHLAHRARSGRLEGVRLEDGSMPDDPRTLGLVPCIARPQSIGRPERSRPGAVSHQPGYIGRSCPSSGDAGGYRIPRDPTHCDFAQFAQPQHRT